MENSCIKSLRLKNMFSKEFYPTFNEDESESSELPGEEGLDEEKDEEEEDEKEEQDIEEDDEAGGDEIE